jgi:hypothetical protein
VLAFHGQHAFVLGIVIASAEHRLILASGALLGWWRRRQKTRLSFRPRNPHIMSFAASDAEQSHL